MNEHGYGPTDEEKALAGKMTQLETERDDALAECERLQKQVGGLETENIILRGQLATNSGDSAERTRLQEQVQDLEKTIETLKKRLKEKEEEIKGLNSKLEQMETQLSETKDAPAEAPANERELADAQAKIVAKDNEIKRLNAELKRKEEELAKEKSARESTSSNKEELSQALEGKLKELEGKLKESKEKIADLESKNPYYVFLWGRLWETRTLFIWGYIWKALTIILDVVAVWLFAYCTQGRMTIAANFLMTFLTVSNILIIITKILNSYFEFIDVRFRIDALSENVCGSVLFVVALILIILVFGVGLS